MILCLKPAENYISIHLSSQQQKEVKVNVVTDEAMLKPKLESVEKLVQHVSLSPDGNRVLIEA